MVFPLWLDAFEDCAVGDAAALTDDQQAVVRLATVQFLVELSDQEGTG